jgi:hypothetical protein
MAFADWSTTAGANTTVGGIDIGEGCPPSNLNNAQREVMAELRAAFSAALATFFAAGDLAAARTALGVLGLAGGTVTGNITRGSAGSHLYHTNAALTSGRVFLTASGASDPTSLAGDIWITY